MPKEACLSSLGEEGIVGRWTYQKPTKAWKVDCFFEKAPGLSQTQANIIPGEQKSSHSLGLSVSFSLLRPVMHSPVHLHILSHPGAHNYTGLAATGAHSRWWGLQKIKLQYEAETLDTGCCFGLTEDMVGNFPRWDWWRREQGQPSIQINHIATLQFLMHGFLEPFLAIPWKSMISTHNHMVKERLEKWRVMSDNRIFPLFLSYFLILRKRSFAKTHTLSDITMK